MPRKNSSVGTKNKKRDVTEKPRIKVEKLFVLVDTKGHVQDTFMGKDAGARARDERARLVKAGEGPLHVVQMVPKLKNARA